MLDNEKKLQRLDRDYRNLRVFEVFVLFLVVAYGIFTTIQLQNQINENHRSAVAGRQANDQRQVEIKAYIKCILLIRYDNPGLTQESPKDDVEKALDTCATKTQPKP